MLLEVVPLRLLVLLCPLVSPHVPRGEVEQLVETGGVHGASGEEHLGVLGDERSLRRVAVPDLHLHVGQAGHHELRGLLQARVLAVAVDVSVVVQLAAIYQVWSLYQLYSVDFLQKSAFSTNEQLRFASVVFGGVLGRHT